MKTFFVWILALTCGFECVPAAALEASAKTALVVKSPAEMPPVGVRGSATAQHRKALDLALNGDTSSALKILMSWTRDSSISKAEQDRIWLSIGRLHYENGSMEKALAAYEKVRKGGASWLEALEERAWCYLQMEKPNEALALLKTVLSPLFKDRVAAEPYFAMALAQLRICDYKAFYATLNLFKERFRERAKTWEASADPGSRVRLRELSDTIQKMNVVEAEVIQRLYIDEDGKNGASAPKIIKPAGDLSFPDVDGDEVWLDEVDNFKVSVRGCLQKGRL